MVVAPKTIKPRSQMNERVVTPKQQLRPKIINNEATKLSATDTELRNEDHNGLNASKSAST